MIKNLLVKLRKREYTVGIVGLGYVGLPLAIRFCEEGFPVIGFDIDSKKIEALKKGKSYIEHISEEKISILTKSETVFTDFPNVLSEADTIILCVPTPISKNKEPDLNPIMNSMRLLSPCFREGQLIVLESTTYPNTTEGILKPFIEALGLRVGENIFLAFSPEREDPANPVYSVKNIPKVVGGCSTSCQLLAASLYEDIVDEVVCVSSPKIAEMTKILENTYRFINISFINEMKMICDRMGMDIYEVIEAAKTKPFGFTPFYPCGGVGGHCIGVDPYYLRFKTKEFGIPTRFIELAGEINDLMPEYVVCKIAEALNHYGKAVKGSKILLLGVAYKKNVDDIRESAAIEIRHLLQEKYAIVRYSDPHIPVWEEIDNIPMSSYELTEETLKFFDCVVLLTDHDGYDYDLIERFAPLIVDTRGKYTPNGKDIFRA